MKKRKMIIIKDDRIDTSCDEHMRKMRERFSSPCIINVNPDNNVTITPIFDNETISELIERVAYLEQELKDIKRKNK